MDTARVEKLIAQPEGLTLEFKEASGGLPESLFESVCAFLNREGGTIALGVDDDGSVPGIGEEAVQRMQSDIVALSNNPQKLDPPFVLFPQHREVDGKHILLIQVPVSSRVHRCLGEVYDRSHDGDFKITDAAQIANLYNRKRTHYTENMIYPALRFEEDFRIDLLSKVKALIRSRTPDHPWLPLEPEDLLKKAGMYQRDRYSGKEGYTLAAILLMGTDETIQSVLPHYKVDALVRRRNVDRYDDRLNIRTNLVEAYELLMGFVEKHLDDPFYLEGDIRIDLRDKIFREIVANMLVHREYTDGHGATFTIFADRVETLNASIPHGMGEITP